jgi:glucose-6-phosphate isomerase
MLPLGSAAAPHFPLGGLEGAIRQFTTNRCHDIDLSGGDIRGVRRRETWLSNMSGYFVDQPAYARALEQGDRILYHVCPVQSENLPGDMHFGLGVLHPGRIGSEFAMTKGHFHSRREAAEVYFILRGDGAMLLEEEGTGTSDVIALARQRIVYVPGHHAHRTYNLGDKPLIYLGIYSADAGHDYGSITEQGFRKTIVATSSGPACVDRSALKTDIRRVASS